MNRNHGFIVGAYPCAPSFHQLDRDQETGVAVVLVDLSAAVLVMDGDGAGGVTVERRAKTAGDH